MENFIWFCRMYVSLLFGLTVVLCSIVVMYLGIRLIQRTNRQDIWALLQFLKPYVQALWAWWWKKYEKIFKALVDFYWPQVLSTANAFPLDAFNSWDIIWDWIVELYNRILHLFSTLLVHYDQHQQHHTAEI